MMSYPWIWNEYVLFYLITLYSDSSPHENICLRILMIFVHTAFQRVTYVMTHRNQMGNEDCNDFDPVYKILSSFL